MAQSAPEERALLGIEPFWERPTPESHLRWDRWRIILKLAIFAKEGISIDILRETTPDNVTFPLNLSMRKMWTKAGQNVREIVELRKNNLKMHGSTNVRRLRWRENCAAIDHESSVKAKLSHLHTSVLARIFGSQGKAIEYLVLKNQRHRLTKFWQKTYGRVWIRFSLNTEIYHSIVKLT